MSPAQRILAAAVCASLLAGGSPRLAAAPDECATAPAAWLFCHGFESGDFAVWDDYDGNPATTNAIIADPGPTGSADNHVARLRVPPGRGTADLVKILPLGHDRLYARWYVQWEPGYDFTARNHGSGLHAGSRDLLGHSGDRPAGDDWFSAWLEPQTRDTRLTAYTYYRGMYMDCPDPVDVCWGDVFPCMIDEGQAYCTRPQHRETVLPPPLTAGRWYCLEVMLDGGTPSADGSVRNGVLDFWVDGVEIGPWSDLWLRTTSALKPSTLWLALFFHEEHAAAGILIDDVVLSTERIGPRDGLSPAPTTSWGRAKGLYR